LWIHTERAARQPDILTANNITPNNITLNNITPNNITPNNITPNNINPNNIIANNYAVIPLGCKGTSPPHDFNIQ
jgi:hypothetical protein